MSGAPARCQPSTTTLLGAYVVHASDPRRKGQERQARQREDCRLASRRHVADGVRLSRRDALDARLAPPADAPCAARSEGIAHVVNTNSQYNLPMIERKLRYAANRHDVTEQFTDASARKNIEVDLAMLGHYGEQIQQVELYLEQNAKMHDPQMFYLLRSVP